MEARVTEMLNKRTTFKQTMAITLCDARKLIWKDLFREYIDKIESTGDMMQGFGNINHPYEKLWSNYYGAVSLLSSKCLEKW